MFNIRLYCKHFSKSKHYLGSPKFYYKPFLKHYEDLIRIWVEMPLIIFPIYHSDIHNTHRLNSPTTKSTRFVKPLVACIRLITADLHGELLIIWRVVTLGSLIKTITAKRIATLPRGRFNYGKKLSLPAKTDCLH